MNDPASLRCTSGNDAAAIVRGVVRLFARLQIATLTEVRLANGRRADILALDRKGRLTIVEVKSSAADYRADRKWPAYRPFCDFFAFAVGTDFPRSILPQTEGLIVADAYGATLLRPPAPQPLAPARRRAVTLAFARLAAARLLRHGDPEIAFDELASDW